MKEVPFAEGPDDVRRKLRDLSAFQAFISVLIQEQNEEGLIQLVASALLSEWPIEVGAVAIRRTGSEDWKVYGRTREGSLVEPAAGELADIVERESSISGSGVRAIHEFTRFSSLRELGLRSIYLLPVQALKGQLAVMIVGTTVQDGLTSSQSALLSLLGNHFAVALRNVRFQSRLRVQSEHLEQTVRRRTAELQRKQEEQLALVNIARAVSAHLDKKELFHAIAQAVKSLVPFDRMGILLPSGDERHLILYAFEAQAGKPLLKAGVTFPRAGTGPGWVLDHKRSFIADGLEDLKRFPVSMKAVRREGMQSSCVLPLLAEDKALGALVFHAQERRKYRPEHLPLLEEMGAVIAIALDNSLAYEEINRLKEQLVQENIYLQEEIKTLHNFEEIVGKSRALRRTLKRVEMVAPTDSSVLITGETGTGKELIARAIHNLSRRKARPLVKVNCAALPTGLIESELFGHEKGAFTGAIARRIGRFELAHQGTIFLDEVGDVPPEVQAKLLRFLQEQEFERVGGTRTIAVDVRVIAATNRNLEKALEEGHFRADLYYRLSVFPVQLPPLRDRPEDVPLLVQYFIEKYATKMGRAIDQISQVTMEWLVSYPWPGNVRELENVVERGIILSTGPTLRIEDELLFHGGRPERTAVPTLEELEHDHIVKTLERTGWVIEGTRGAARILDLHPSTLRSHMKKLGIQRPG